MYKPRLEYSKVTRDEEPDGESLLPLALVKTHLRVDHDVDDTLIELYRDAAIAVAENETNRNLVEAEYSFWLNRFPLCTDRENATCNLPFCPVTEFTSVEYKDENGDLIALDAANYDVDIESEPSKISFNETPEVNEDIQMTVKITATAGYTAENLPTPIKNGMLMLIGHWYENRQDAVIGTITAEVPKASAWCFAKYRLLYY